MEKKKNINIYHVHILTILEKEVKLMENLEIDSNKIKTIKELKYINLYMNSIDTNF
jgi:hypothetical protein